MSEARETSKDIKVYDYSILGDTFRLWRNADGKTLFVVDDTITEYKPNVMLVLPPDEDNRKWDDVLQNDFGIDLETVRPKKNNKYQKLDIEYASVDVRITAVPDSVPIVVVIIAQTGRQILGTPVQVGT